MGFDVVANVKRSTGWVRCRSAFVLSAVVFLVVVIVLTFSGCKASNDSPAAICCI